MAIRETDKELAIYYIKQGADIDYCCFDGLSLLHKAAGVPGDDVDYVRILLNNGANINKVIRSGSALHEAAEYMNPNIAVFLIEKGIRLDARDKEGYTAFEKAKESLRNYGYGPEREQRTATIRAMIRARAKQPAKRQMTAFLKLMNNTKKRRQLDRTRNVRKKILYYMLPNKFKGIKYYH